jgi:hypothetical protein
MAHYEEKLAQMAILPNISLKKKTKVEQMSIFARLVIFGILCLEFSFYSLS